MLSIASSYDASARTNYRVHAEDVAKVLCHRRADNTEQFLVRWRTSSEPAVHPRAICSWHTLEELDASLHHVQTYIQSLSNRRRYGDHLDVNTSSFSATKVNLKRKAPGSVPLSRDSGYPTPLSRESSHVSDISASTTSSDTVGGAYGVYNGVLQKKAGRIIARKSRFADHLKTNATKLPTGHMLEVAASTPISQEVDLRIRHAFLNKLQQAHRVGLENNVDNSTPSLNFTFINEYVLREGVYRADPETFEGCQECRPNMGQNIGCEYPQKCSCLEFAGVNEHALKRQDPVLFRRYKEVVDRGDVPDTTGLPKRFPYQKASQDGRIPRILLPFYRESRHAIYECNQQCKCGPECKSRLVQKGRTLALTIFKTADRGWGVKCDEDIVTGEFVDTYLGEVVTNAEATRREEKGSADKASYLYSLDKFTDDDETLTAETCHVVDGQYMGGPSRFINHSCEPNCRQFTVSYNKHDFWVYDLAFFAIDDIKAGTELTFDYMDKDEEEEDEVLRKREAALSDPENADKRPCNCGARKCRGFLWV